MSNSAPKVEESLSFEHILKSSCIYHRRTAAQATKLGAFLRVSWDRQFTRVRWRSVHLVQRQTICLLVQEGSKRHVPGGVRRRSLPRQGQLAPLAGPPAHCSGSARIGPAGHRLRHGHSRPVLKQPIVSLQNERLLFWWWPEKIKKEKVNPPTFRSLCASQGTVSILPLPPCQCLLFSLEAGWVLYNAKYSYWHFTKNLK